MKKKIIIFSGILLFIVIITIFSNNFSLEEREEDEIIAEEILDYTFENYDIHAASSGHDDGENPVLFFDINPDTVDIEEFHSDILDKLKQYDLADKYTIEIEQTSTEEARLEILEMNITEMVQNYLKENGMDQNVTYAANIDENLHINLTIRDGANIDKEELEKIMDEFFDFEVSVEE
ncbi:MULTISPECIES: hypothetical protein [Oceanobacillus]|uniref:Stage III sporulation protein AH n=1 Tax=Oceanobacillus aidingensis TaxID=645964 RepID=A0ABV9K1I4_9BACI|nr:hypothetical protein [Oceanobacillus oncorhynchi]MDM8101796.1 hypothetical protein [Oceanobacillus oncorhynchi]